MGALTTLQKGVGFSLSFPLFWGSGRPLGALITQSKKVGGFAPHLVGCFGDGFPSIFGQTRPTPETPRRGPPRSSTTKNQPRRPRVRPFPGEPFFPDRKLSMFGVCAAPGAPKILPGRGGGGEAPSPPVMICGIPGAARTRRNRGTGEGQIRSHFAQRKVYPRMAAQQIYDNLPPALHTHILSDNPKRGHDCIYFFVYSARSPMSAQSSNRYRHDQLGLVLLGIDCGVEDIDNNFEVCKLRWG